MTSQAQPSRGGVASAPAPFFTRWQRALIVCTGVAVGGGVGWFLFHVKSQPHARANALLAEERGGDPSASEKPQRDPPLQPDKLTEQPKDKGANKPDRPADRAAVDALRTSLGTLTGITFRQAFLNVGLLADGVEGGTYEVADARKTLTTVTTLLDTADRQLEQLPESAFEAEDRKQLAQARGVLRLLRAQARALRAYWANKNEQTAEAFQKARAAAWEAIKELLEIDDD
jgi:hypothetical protein